MNPSPLVDSDFAIPYPFRREPVAAKPVESPRRRLSHREFVAKCEADIDRRLAEPDVSVQFRRLAASARRRGCTLARHSRFGLMLIPVNQDSAHMEQAALERETLEEEQSSNVGNDFFEE